ncbi:MAG: hypothetical protein HYT75_05395, partial [Deltaproteobacteria bacterium]|nr:hypothetical protein [Deltaproteobacteria bacterium]
MAGKVDNSLIKSGTNVDVCLEPELTSGGGLTPSCEMTPSDVSTDVSTSETGIGQSDISNFSAEAEEKKCLMPNDSGP